MADTTTEKKFGKERGAGFIDIQKSDSAKIAKFVEIWNAKPDHKLVIEEGKEVEKRLTLAEYAGFDSIKEKNSEGKEKTVWIHSSEGAFDEFLTPATKLEQLRAKANELRSWGADLKMREVQSFNSEQRKAFVIAWENSETLHEVLDQLVKSGHVKCDLSDSDEVKEMKTSLRSVAKGLIAAGLPLKQTFMKSNKKIPHETFIAICNQSKDWREVLNKLIDLDLADDEKKIGSLKLLQKNIVDERAKEGKANPFKVEFKRTPRIDINGLQALLADVRAGKKIEIEDASGKDESPDDDDDDDDATETENETPVEKDELDDAFDAVT
jgi:hypothetical protein